MNKSISSFFDDKQKVELTWKRTDGKYGYYCQYAVSVKGDISPFTQIVWNEIIRSLGDILPKQITARVLKETEAYPNGVDNNVQKLTQILIPTAVNSYINKIVENMALDLEIKMRDAANR